MGALLASDFFNSGLIFPKSPKGMAGATERLKVLRQFSTLPQLHVRWFHLDPIAERYLGKCLRTFAAI